MLFRYSHGKVTYFLVNEQFHVIAMIRLWEWFSMHKKHFINLIPELAPTCFPTLLHEIKGANSSNTNNRKVHKVKDGCQYQAGVGKLLTKRPCMFGNIQVYL